MFPTRTTWFRVPLLRPFRGALKCSYGPCLRVKIATSSTGGFPQYTVGMDRDVLMKIAKRERIRDDAYSFDGALRENTLVLATERRRWVIKRVKRGEPKELAWFDTEVEACEYLLEALLSDPTTRWDYARDSNHK